MSQLRYPVGMQTFSNLIEEVLADKHKESFDTTLKELRDYYDGYLFSMAQIHSRDYAGRYALDPRPIYLIAANFNEKKEN